tara:strand:- start:447 stop:881 length:435 start_codon:yes stop_codon:yes gene_type:complete
MITYAKHEEEFYGVMKLTTGEEVLGKIVLTCEKDETLCFIQEPVCVQVIQKQIEEDKVARGIGFHKWMQLSDEDFYIVREKDILSISSMSKEVVFMYESFIASEAGGSKLGDKKIKMQQPSEKHVGFLGKIDDARKLFEKLYKT